MPVATGTKTTSAFSALLIPSTIEAFTTRYGFDLKRIALLGWAQSQRDEKPKAIMRTFCKTVLSQLARCAAHWKAAVVGGIDPRTPRQGVEKLVSYRVG